ncbi:acyl carrier protein [Amycolatopsis magusensis]|uniref:acyl carrier protein n=1 Tax=Amycolatopsis magusensis TaxID=882444 RepID=UPI0037AC7ACF
MNTVDDLVTLVRDELGLPVTTSDAGRSLDELPGWDSVYLLWLLTAVEKKTGRPVSLPDLLEAGSLSDVYSLVAA